VPHVDEIETRVERRVEHRHDMIARQREHALAAEPRQGSSDDVGAAQRRAHRVSSRATVNAARIQFSLIPLVSSTLDQRLISLR